MIREPTDEIPREEPRQRLDGVLRMKYNAYKEETCQFLATLEVILDERGSQGAQATRGGRIQFKGYKGTRLVVTLSVLAEIYGLSADGQPELSNEPGESVHLWNFIANGVYHPGDQRAHIFVIRRLGTSRNSCPTRSSLDAKRVR
ncbi:unnamed protein product [Cochlearia groenlandica]